MIVIELTEHELESLRYMLREWVNEGFDPPPYRDASMYDVFEKVGLTPEMIANYDIRRPA